MRNKFIEDKNGKRYIAICSFCGNKAPQKVLFEHTVSDTAYSPDGDEVPFEVYYMLTECSTCDQVLLYAIPEYFDHDDELEEYILYPSKKRFSTAVPTQVLKAYSDAATILKVGSPTAYAILIRRALEFLLKDKKIEGKNLYEQLKNMASQNLIPSIFLEMTDGIRILGNFAAHAPDVEIDAEDVKIMDDFFSALMEYVYVAPDKVAKLKKRLEKFKK